MTSVASLRQANSVRRVSSVCSCRCSHEPRARPGNGIFGQTGDLRASRTYSLVTAADDIGTDPVEFETNTMTNTRAFLSLSAALITAGVALAQPALQPVARVAPVGDELDELVQERARAAEALGLDAIWREAHELAILVGDEEGAAFDAALDRALAGEAEGASKGRLLLAAARLLGEDIDWSVWCDSLIPLLERRGEVSLGAAELLGNDQVKSQADLDVLTGLGDALCKVATDGERDTKERVQCAISAHRVGLGQHISTGRRVLFDFMNSADPNLRSAGALAFGQLGIIEEVANVEDELTRMAGLPGAEGHLAAAYLKQQEIRRYMDRQLKRERDRAKSMVSGPASGVSPDLERVEKVIELIRDYHLEGDKVSREDLIGAALDGMLQSLDRHSSYFSPESYMRFEQDLEAEYGGIGAYVGVDREDSLFTITRPIYSGPAYRAGLTTDDKIVRIGNWPTIGEETDEIIKRLKGKPGTPVALYVWRQGMDPGLIERPTEDMLVTLERDQITIPPVHSEYLPGDIGLIELTTFSRVASQELLTRVVDFRERGMKGLILDLRNNTGGLLSEARNVAEILLPAGKAVVSTENRAGRSRALETRLPAAIDDDLPVVVLINRFSASAAEIVSGALQDLGRAKLVGQLSFGKGSVQNLLPIPGEQDDEYADENDNRRHDNWETITKDWNGNGEFDYAPRIKLTIERYLLPTGRSIHRELDDEGNIINPGGVSPDVPVAARRWPQWRLVEMRRLQGERKIREWATENIKGHEQEYEGLATSDLGDPNSYPGFDELYASLGTVLPKDDVRYLMRLEVRRLVQDKRGEAFPQGDFEEDLQLQAAIKLILEEGGQHGVDDIVAYAKSFGVGADEADQGPPRAVAVAPELTGRIDHALALIAEAEDGTGLTADSLKELSKVLEAIKGEEN